MLELTSRVVHEWDVHLDGRGTVGPGAVGLMCDPVLDVVNR